VIEAQVWYNQHIREVVKKATGKAMTLPEASMKYAELQTVEDTKSLRCTHPQCTKSILFGYDAYLGTCCFEHSIFNDDC